jgi:hypothetical protein
MRKRSPLADFLRMVEDIKLGLAERLQLRPILLP